MAAVTSSVSLIVVPPGVLGDTWTTTVKLAEEPEASVAIVRDRARAARGGTGQIERRPRGLRFGDEGRVGRQDVRQRHGLGVAGAGVCDRDRVGDSVASEYRAGGGRLRHRYVRLCGQ